MGNPSRRAFVVTVVASGSALAASRVSAQAAGPTLEESDPQAAALGYKADSAKVDKAKFPQHAATQLCSGCVLFQGKPADATGPCALFAGKQVAAKGWCSAFAKKP